MFVEINGDIFEYIDKDGFNYFYTDFFMHKQKQIDVISEEDKNQLLRGVWIRRREDKILWYYIFVKDEDGTIFTITYNPELKLFIYEGGILIERINIPDNADFYEVNSYCKREELSLDFEIPEGYVRIGHEYPPK